MNLHEYVTIEEVKRVCRKLGIRDWTALSTTDVLPEEAQILQDLVVPRLPRSRQLHSKEG